MNREPCVQVLASLAAAISLLERGGKKAAPSDLMFEQMLADYKAALKAGRAAISQQVEPVAQCDCKELCEQRGLASDEVDSTCKAVYGTAALTQPAPAQDEVQAVIRNLRCIAKTALSGEARSSMRADLESAIRLLATRPAQTEQLPVGWYTEDHLTDKSATTYEREVADRWRAKGWPVNELFAAPIAQTDIEAYDRVVKEAARWRYTQHEHFFQCGPRNTDGEWSGYSVGVLKFKDDKSAHFSTPPYKRQLGLSNCIEGRGDTLEEAIDRALGFLPPDEDEDEDDE